jgi:hypothetical protein
MRIAALQQRYDMPPIRAVTNFRLQIFFRAAPLTGHERLAQT